MSAMRIEFRAKTKATVGCSVGERMLRLRASRIHADRSRGSSDSHSGHDAGDSRAISQDERPAKVREQAHSSRAHLRNPTFVLDDVSTASRRSCEDSFGPGTSRAQRYAQQALDVRARNNGVGGGSLLFSSTWGYQRGAGGPRSRNPKDCSVRLDYSREPDYRQLVAQGYWD